MRRKTAITVMLTLLCSLLVFDRTEVVTAESMYIRKIVSVVYDDSGSMRSQDRWANANYAMQMFCGMLNSEDQLYVTYMHRSQSISGYTPEKVDLSAVGIQASVDAIRAIKDDGSTPYTAVELAFDKLKQVPDANPNTQYWLVVITDGAFDECATDGVIDDKDRKFLNDHLDEYTKTVMPNGTTPKVTYLSIAGALAPDEDQSKGIYTYYANNTAEIIDAMNGLADRVSGRTRLDRSSITILDSNTLQVSSAIPLLNIAAFVQGSDVRIVKATHGQDSIIPISRQALINYPNHPNLQGSSYLLGDSQTVIGSGTYNIVFDKEVDINDVVVLFEPALETRMTITLNGKEIVDNSELDDAQENDKVSVSCKIYEMGTNKEIDPSLLPAGTSFEITVLENGTEVKKSTGQEMTLSDYVLKQVPTELSAAVIIEGFSPIQRSVRFTPKEYAPRVVYTISSAFESDTKSVKYDDIASNKDLAIGFTVYADGNAITDANTVKDLNPTINVSPQGNGGNVSYSDDGRIIFTPNVASTQDMSAGSYTVDVTCTLLDGTSARETYTVLLSDYQVFAADADRSVKKTELFENTASVSFYITKDGVRLGKADVEQQLEILLNKEHEKLKTRGEVSDDGTITVTPYSEEKHELTFGSWWKNWIYYFGLSGKDVEVTLRHQYGTGKAKIDIVGEDSGYVMWNVYAPLLLELLLLASIIAYIVRYFTKARFAPNGVLYVGSITRNRGNGGSHSLELAEFPLRKYNKFSNLWNPFKELTVSVGGISVTAGRGNTIICNEQFPWYSDAIRPKARSLVIRSPKEVVEHCSEGNGELIIYEISPSRVMDEQDRHVSQDDTVYYFSSAEIDYERSGPGKREVIESANAFCYSTLQ